MEQDDIYPRKPSSLSLSLDIVAIGICVPTSIRRANGSPVALR